MKKAISLMAWVDVTDGHEYREGEPFPHDGREIGEDRIDELSSPENMIGTPVITLVEVEEPKKKAK